MPTDIYVPHAIKFASGTDITQLDAITPDPGLDPLTVFSASEPTPGFTGSRSARPSLSLVTTQIKEVLDRVGIPAGAPVATAHSATNVLMEWRKVVSLTGRAALASAVHTKVTMANSLMFWDAIDAPQDGDATISFMFVPVSVSGAAPMVYATNTALTASSAVQGLYEAGPVVLDGSTLCVRSWRWNNNIAEFPRLRCGGSSYPEFVAVDRLRPVVTVEVSDITGPLSAMPAGAAVTSLVCYLRKKAASGINELDNATVAISLSSSSGTVYPRGPRTYDIVLHSFAIDTTADIV